MDRSEALIYQEKDNRESIVYDLRLLEEEQNWSYLRHAQVNGGMDHRERMEEEEEEKMIYGIAGNGLLPYLNKKDKKMRAESGADGE